MTNLMNFNELRRESETEFTFSYDKVDLVVKANVDSIRKFEGDGYWYPYTEDVEVRDIDFDEITLITENSTAKVKPSERMLNDILYYIKMLVESEEEIFRPKRKTA